MVIFIILFITVQLNHILPLLNMGSGFKNASDWLCARNKAGIIAFSRPKLWEARGIEAFDVEGEFKKGKLVLKG